MKSNISSKFTAIYDDSQMAPSARYIGCLPHHHVDAFVSDYRAEQPAAIIRTQPASRYRVLQETAMQICVE